MERRIVEYAELTPNYCVFCGGSDGPFLEAQTMQFGVATPNGPVTIEGTLYVCLGTFQNPGCLPQFAEEIGGASPWSLQAVADAARARVLELEEEIAELRLSLAESEALQGPRVVPVDDLLRELRGAAHVSASVQPRSAAVELTRRPPPPPPAYQPPAPPHPDSMRAREQSGYGLTGRDGGGQGKGGMTISIE